MSSMSIQFCSSVATYLHMHHLNTQNSNKLLQKSRIVTTQQNINPSKTTKFEPASTSTSSQKTFLLTLKSARIDEGWHSHHSRKRQRCTEFYISGFWAASSESCCSPRWTKSKTIRCLSIEVSLYNRRSTEVGQWSIPSHRKSWQSQGIV